MDYRALYDRAHAAGMAAGREVNPHEYVVLGQAGNGPVRIAGFLADGLCGFAWVVIPGNSGMARWARAEKLARPGYPSGTHFWVGEFNQSHERKVAYAHAFAEVLREAGIKAYTGDRLD